MHTVGEVARMAGITVRALHHYDEIGLVTPSGRSASGYRLYSQADLRRLQEVLYFRELGMELGAIKEALDATAGDRVAVLRAQREGLAKKRELIDRMLRALDEALAAEEEGSLMDAKDMLEVFDGFDPSEYEHEVRERWGSTDAYRESARRTARYTKEDWERIKAEGQAASEALIAAFDAGVPADSELAREAVRLWWEQIDRNFYTMTPGIALGLAEMFVADPRFARTYETMRPGLAAYFRDAIVAAVHSGHP
ncbi:MAG: MerR family transcriptional regulator [Coriobacteriia bacterium]|nr:MerR family transcriptional regulator [Coriobacteriia bacterium]